MVYSDWFALYLFTSEIVGEGRVIEDLWQNGESPKKKVNKDWDCNIFCHEGRTLGMNRGRFYDGHFFGAARLRCVVILVNVFYLWELRSYTKIYDSKGLLLLLGRKQEVKEERICSTGATSSSITLKKFFLCSILCI